MAEEIKNAQVTNGVNGDITELKSLTTLRKRVISDAEIVSKSANGFRLANGETGVILRNDGQTFYALTTPSGQAQDGQWNTLRPFAFSLSTGRVFLSNGADISGGALVSHNDGIGAVTTGPASLISGQIYGAPAMYTDFNTGNVSMRMLMGSRVVAGKEDYGLLSYRDWQGNSNELKLRKGAELEAGQYTKRNPEGWFVAQGVYNVSSSERNTFGLNLQGMGTLFANLYLSERIGKNHFMGFHVGGAGNNGIYEFRQDGQAYANGGWNSSSDVRMKTEIVKIDGALEKLGRIGGYTYLKQGVPEAGVIAQEVERVLPQSVTTMELKLNDGSTLKDARGININGVVALLIEALKEERAARIEDRRELESRLTALENAVLNKQS